MSKEKNYEPLSLVDLHTMEDLQHRVKIGLDYAFLDRDDDTVFTTIANDLIQAGKLFFPHLAKKVDEKIEELDGTKLQEGSRYILKNLDIRTPEPFKAEITEVTKSTYVIFDLDSTYSERVLIEDFNNHFKVFEKL